MRIGVISDTHGYFDPHTPLLFQGVEEILHAGDVGSAAVLDQLRSIAPVQAVRGNVDRRSWVSLQPLPEQWEASESTCCTIFPSLSRRYEIGPRQTHWKGKRLSTASGFWKAFLPHAG